MKKKILINGHIYTENPDFPWAQAMVIDGKRLAYVGDNNGAKDFYAKAGSGTDQPAFAEDAEVIDLEGKTVHPLLPKYFSMHVISENSVCVFLFLM